MSIKKRSAYLFISAVAVSLALQVANAQAQPPVHPVDMLKNVSQRMLSHLRQNRAAIRRDPSKLRVIVERVLTPNMAVGLMARRVVGRYWPSGNTQQEQILRDQFISEFTELVVRNYSTALSSYEDQEIRFFPVRGRIPVSAQASAPPPKIRVNSRIINHDRSFIPVAYHLILLKDGWKVYDFSVDNVGFIQSYRSQFASVLANGGFSALLRQLKAHNRTVILNNGHAKTKHRKHSRLVA